MQINPSDSIEVCCGSSPYKQISEKVESTTESCQNQQEPFFSRINTSNYESGRNIAISIQSNTAESVPYIPIYAESKITPFPAPHEKTKLTTTIIVIIIFACILIVIVFIILIIIVYKRHKMKILHEEGSDKNLKIIEGNGTTYVKDKNDHIIYQIFDYSKFQRSKTDDETNEIYQSDQISQASVDECSPKFSTPSHDIETPLV